MFNKTLVQIALIGLTSMASFSASANEAANIEVSHPFAREVPPSAMASASFMTLKNTSDKDILLVNANSSVAQTVELHTHLHEDGVMKMRQVPNIKIPAHGEATLQPGGLHIMLIHLNQDLKAGDEVKVNLTFDDGSHKEVSMPVKSLMGAPSPMGNMQHMSH